LCCCFRQLLCSIYQRRRRCGVISCGIGILSMAQIRGGAIVVETPKVMNYCYPKRDVGAAARVSIVRGGFTLIELLTVIAIIGILAAIIIPVVGKVRQSAQSATCASNLRQIGLAVFLYADANRNRFPPAQAPDYLEWHRLLAPYFGQKAIGWPAEGGDYLVCKAEEILPQARRTNYATNPNLFVDSGGNPNRVLFNRSRLTRPSQIIMVGDSLIRSATGNAVGPHFYDQTDIYAGGSPDQPLPQVTGELAAFSYRHNGRFNAVFADGHVNGFRVGEVLRKNVRDN
jgi:prepilin-type N-terminal cleavage/methylation domain-containing protein/prepilin-type processing-associated H-X9-DG protein